ncbi:MAG TPA: pyridoxal kinase [Caulobacterales bacterium]|nr:pyridoxal kinase [Caulobacterales bacterium]
MKTVLSIQSQVATARVGNSVAAFAMERLGVRVFQLPTTILGRRPDRGAPGGGPIPRETLQSLIEGVSGDERLGEIDAVLSGYVGDSEQVGAILDIVERVKAAREDAIFMCDPVLGDDGKLFVSEAVADAVLNGLAPHADWLAPNAFELGLAAGRPIANVDEARSAARRLGKPVLASSIPTESGLGVLYAAPGGDWLCETQKLPHAPKGAGDLLSALFLARRLQQQPPAVALEAATGSVYDVIVRSIAAQSADLALPLAQDMLVDPMTWPQAQALPV